MTKKRIILFAVALLLSLGGVEAKKIPGQVIGNDGTVKDVIFNLPVNLFGDLNYQKIQSRIVYYEGEKRTVLKPDDAREINFTYQHENVRMLSRVNSIRGGSIFSSQKNIFLKLIIDGKLKLFEFFFKSRSPGMQTAGGFSPGTTYTVETFIMQKGDAPLKEIAGLGFRKDMSDYFRDCPEVADQIKTKELRRRDIEVIVMEYNRKCGL